MLLLPTKFWAIPIMVAISDCSPWWYALNSPTDLVTDCQLVTHIWAEGRIDFRLNEKKKCKENWPTQLVERPSSHSLSSFWSLQKLARLWACTGKQVNRIFLCPGFKPSTTQGMDLLQSSMENRINSWIKLVAHLHTSINLVPYLWSRCNWYRHQNDLCKFLALRKLVHHWKHCRYFEVTEPIFSVIWSFLAKSKIDMITVRVWL